MKRKKTKSSSAPNGILNTETLIAIEKAAKGEDMIGPFDTVEELMQSLNAPDKEDFKVNFRLQEERIATMRKEMDSQNRGLYRESFEHDNCGIGAIVNIKGKKTHSTVAGALSIVEQLEHRAGKDAEGKTGDGVGILTQIPHGFFKKVCQPLGIKLKGERDYGVGMFFLPQDELKRNQAKKIFEVIVKKEGLKLLGWREVPIHPDILGKSSLISRICTSTSDRPIKYSVPVVCVSKLKEAQN